MTRLFDTDTKALRQREQLNIEGARYNLEDWIIHQVNPYEGMRVLDLGCGTGKQIFAFAPIVLSDGYLLGLDISNEAVMSVNAKAEMESLGFVKAIEGSIDDCSELLGNRKFDLILSTYAIYYSKAMVEVISDLRYLLNPKGQVFICGYGKGSNQEMIDLINQSISDPALRVKEVHDFIESSEVAEVGKSYSEYRIVRLNNQIRFNSPEGVLKWWENHNSFAREIYDQVSESIQVHFAEKGEFVLTKNVLGIQYYV